MKSTILIMIVGFSALFASAGTPEASQEIIIGLSPFQPAAERSKQQALLQRFVVADCPNGSRVVVWDGWALTVVCDVQLPKLAYDTPAARAPRVAPALAALKQWFAALDGKQTPAGMKDTGAIKVPEWLQAATAQPATSRRTIIILASPFCLVPNEPSFSMIETRYPSDGHLNAGDKSIYSITKKHGRLANTTVFWSYRSENVWASQNHRERVTRWWSLFIAGQGPNAMLAAFSADTPQILLAATRANQQAIGEYAVNPDDSAVLMHDAEQRQVPVEIQARPAPPPEPMPQHVTMPEPPPAPTPVAVVVTPPPPAPVAPPTARVETPPRAPEPEARAKPVEETATIIPVPAEIPKPAVGNIGIAAVWNAERGTDIDLWVAAKPGLPEAYWNRPRVERVRYFRDIRTAQTVKDNAQWRAVWEYVEVEGAQIAEPTVWLNVYEAKGPVSGIVRVQFNGRVEDCPFQFNVTSGNHGRDSNIAVRSRSPYWLEIRLDEIFKQTPTGHAISPPFEMSFFLKYVAPVRANTRFAPRQCLSSHHARFDCRLRLRRPAAWCGAGPTRPRSFRSAAGARRKMN